MQETFVEKIFRTTIATACALFIGMIFVTLLLQEEPWFKKLLQEQAIASIVEFTGPNIKLEVKAVNLLIGEIVIEDFEVSAEDRSWKISNKSFVLKFSLFDLLFRKTFHAQFIIQGMSISSTLQNGDLAITKPLALFLAAPSVIPFKLKGIAIRASNLEIIDIDHTIQAQIAFSSDTYMEKTVVKNKFFIHSGSLSIADNKRIDELQGDLRIAFDTATHTSKIDVHASLSLADARMNSRNCYLNFSYDKVGELSLSSQDKALVFLAKNIDYSQSLAATYQGHLDVNVFFNQTGVIDFSGTFAETLFGFEARTELLCNTISLAPTIKNVDLKFTKNHMEYDVFLDVNKIPIATVKVHKVTESQAKNAEFELSCKSLTEISLSKDYSIKHFLAEAKIASDGKIYGILQGAYSDTTRKLQHIDGEFSYTQGKGNMHIVAADCITKLSYDINKGLYDLAAIDEAGQQLLVCAYESQTEKITGLITIAPIKKLVKHILGMELQGEGTLVINGSVRNKIARIATCLDDGTIKVPHMYNTIKQIDALWILDIAEKKLSLPKFRLTLHTGQIDSIDGACYFTDNWTPKYISVPITIQSCLGNWEKLFFGLASGYIIYSLKDNQSLLSGTIIVDKAHVKLSGISTENKAATVKESMRSVIANEQPIHFDIKVLTKSLIKIKTSFIETEARAKLHIKGTASDPMIYGKISLHEGFLAFPYKPLYIQEAKIYLNPAQLSDSTIELIAKNTIKKFAIQMEVTGSLQAPHIALSSSPTLHEEQILTMLLAGSQEGSLFGVMPHMLMQGVEKILFTTEHSSDWLQSLKNVLKPLGNIRIKPAIFDKQNKPVKGGFEIDINDSLTASIANNLDLTDEPSVEVEYALSDATTLRGTRDDKGNISGEIEVRWKF